MTRAAVNRTQHTTTARMRGVRRLLIIAALVACNAESGDGSPVKQVPSPPPGPVVDAGRPAPPRTDQDLKAIERLPDVAPAAAGIAWLLMKDGALVSIERGRDRVVRRATGDGWRRIALASDGALWGTGPGNQGYWVRRGGKQRAIGVGHLLPQELIPAPDGTLWAWSVTGVSHWNGTAWRHWDGDALAGGDRPLSGLALDAGGRPVVISLDVGAGQVREHVWDGSSWSATELATGGDGVRALTAGDDGAIYALARSVLMRIEGDRRIPLFIGHVSHPAMSTPAGPIAGTTGGLLRGAPGELISVGNAWLLVFRPGAREVALVPFHFPLRCHAGTEAAADRGGRVWLACNDYQLGGGLAVIARSGQLVAWPPGARAIFRPGIAALAVEGGGPQLPGGPGGTVTAVLTRGGQPLAYQPVELCYRPVLPPAEGNTPCALSVFDSAYTDGQGRVRFEGLANATIRLAARYWDATTRQARWAGPKAALCPGRQPTANCDAGVIELD